MSTDVLTCLPVSQKERPLRSTRDPACCRILQVIRAVITPFKGVEGKGISAEICILHIQPMPNQLGKTEKHNTVKSNKKKEKSKQKRK